ncbi:DUF2075 domain-containing protein [Amycolatopsis sp. NPDC021455]|uniref:DUF2075 domain-containing protein n=1 Tax=Amycolatopsis sp. NPDC021455 TaxID=3154901 RepID=UPI0033D46F25
MTSRLFEARTLAQPAEASTSHEAAIRQFSNELVEAGLGSLDVLRDYRLPHSSQEADLVVCGADPATGAPSYVVVEIKLWTGPHRSRLSPVEQAEQHSRYIAAHLPVRGELPAVVTGIAYLPYVDRLPQKHDRLFTGGDGNALRAFLRSHLAADPRGEGAEQLLRSEETAPLRLMASAASEFREGGHLVLLDEQQVAFSLVKEALQRTIGGEDKEIILVSGGPGTGKSSLAISLLGDLHRSGYAVRHATGSRALTTSLRKRVGSRSPGTKGLFTYFNSFATAEPNGLDVLICDEAHRIRASSVNRFTPRAARTQISQVEELVHAARVTVFLIDRNQSVRPGEVGTAELIESTAGRHGWPVHHVDLEVQFGAAGSTQYDVWARRLLGLDAPQLGPVGWAGRPGFALATAGTPQEMEDRLVAETQRGQVARIVAGFCWPSTEARPHQPLPRDVVIGDWARPWTIAGERGVNGAPPNALWAVEPAGFEQIGHVYSAQGFEFDWVGVIFGPDLVWRDDRWVTDRAASCDPALRKADDQRFDAYVRRTYYVLLSRARSGAILYSTDPETREKLRSLVQPSRR